MRTAMETSTSSSSSPWWSLRYRIFHRKNVWSHCKWRAGYKCLVPIYVYSQKWNCVDLLFPKHNLNYNVLTPNFHIHVHICERFIYIFPGSVCLFCCSQNADRSRVYIYRSQIHECRDWEQGHAVSFLGIHKSVYSLDSFLVCVCLDNSPGHSG